MVLVSKLEDSLRLTGCHFRVDGLRTLGIYFHKLLHVGQVILALVEIMVAFLPLHLYCFF
jgi:hypothetical protein